MVRMAVYLSVLNNSRLKGASGGWIKFAVLVIQGITPCAVAGVENDSTEFVAFCMLLFCLQASNEFAMVGEASQ